MKTRSASIILILLLTIGAITVVSFSLGCTEQEEAPAEPSNNTSVEPAETTPLEPAGNTSVEPADNISTELIENATAEPEESIPAGSAVSSGSSGRIDNFGKTDEIIKELEPISADDITNIEWQWTGFQDSDSPDSQVTVPSPERYTLSLFADGAYYIKSDCNTGSGTYTLEGNRLTFDLPVTTLVDCGPESMDVEYTSLIPTVEAAALEDGQLVLYPGNEGDKMFFVNGGKAEQ
ncbi:META domain-containing protein [Methanosarcina hadiensis]|uniref:META domain-containing protein n=1 Tax=Methanosarcina hadiensis TaxID=3078083 RepID=UPI003977DB31